MLLIYTHKTSPRIHYTFDLIFRSILGIDFKITTDLDYFMVYSEAKMSYTHEPIGSELFFKSDKLLFETGISSLTSIQIGKETEHPSDLFAFAFFLVTRYEEYLPFRADHYGRFSAKQSVAYKNNFLQKPIVNCWAHEIKKRILEKYPSLSFPEKKYSYTPTIDIDNAYAYYGKNLIRALGGYARALAKEDKDDFSKRKHVLAGKEKDPYDTYDFQNELHKKYALKPIYFFLLGDRAVNDKNLPYTNPIMQSLIKDIASGAETGIHPSFASNQNPKKVKIEKERLKNITRNEITKSRQHFLMLKFPETYRNLIASGVTDDYTMGYADEVGFRAGICTPCQFYDLQKEETTNLTLHPFAVMDATLLYYMRIKPAEVMSYVGPLIKEIRAVNGTFITIWHNESLSNYQQWYGWKGVYEDIIKAAK